VYLNPYNLNHQQPAHHGHHLGVSTMNTNEIIKAMHEAKVYEAANMQARTGTLDNISMLVAVATGLALRPSELYEVFNALITD
jgi:hypothetical protein